MPPICYNSQTLGSEGGTKRKRILSYQIHLHYLIVYRRSVGFCASIYFIPMRSHVKAWDLVAPRRSVKIKTTTNSVIFFYASFGLTIQQDSSLRIMNSFSLFQSAVWLRPNPLHFDRYQLSHDLLLYCLFQKFISINFNLSCSAIPLF